MEDEDGPGLPPKRPKTELEGQKELLDDLNRKVMSGLVKLKKDSAGNTIISPVESEDQTFHKEISELLEPRDRIWIHDNEGMLKPDSSGDYIEDVHYKKEKLLSGGSSGAEVCVIRDSNTRKPLVRKKMKADDCRPEAIEAHRDLQADSPNFPKLFLVKREGDKVALFMELVSDGVPLSKVCEYFKYWDKTNISPQWRRQFALCLLHKMLIVLKYMKRKRWAHGDLTDSNILLSMSRMDLAIIDLEQAERLLPVADSDSVRAGKVVGLTEWDCRDVFKIFCALYTAGHYTDITQLETDLKKKRSQRLSDGQQALERIPQGEKNVMLEVLRCCQNVIRPSEPDDKDTQKALKEIESAVFPNIHGEAIFRCFLQALDEFSNGPEVKQIERLLGGGSNYEHHSAEAVLDMNRQDLLRVLTPEVCQDVCKRLKMWNILDIDEHDNNVTAVDHLLHCLHEAVASSPPDYRRFADLPLEVREKIDDDLRERVAAQIRAIMERLRLYISPGGDFEGDVDPNRERRGSGPSAAMGDLQHVNAATSPPRLATVPVRPSASRFVSRSSSNDTPPRSLATDLSSLSVETASSSSSAVTATDNQMTLQNEENEDQRSHRTMV